MGAEGAARGLSVGVIMDGNGRWAQKRGLPRTAGHKKGADVFDDITRYANELGIAAITYYAWSTENWSRPADEVEAVMDLLGVSLKRLFRYRKENNRVVFLGDRRPLPPQHRAMMDEIEGETAGRTGMVLGVAVNYGGRQEIVQAVRGIAEDARRGVLEPGAVEADDIERRLYTQGRPGPDFILRTSGERRLSNFLLWQSAYSELIFTDTLWPDFTRKDFDRAIEEYAGRSRRFGGV